MARNKTPDTSSGDNKSIITAPIVLKSFRKKNGELTDKKEAYIQRSIQDYFIKFCESEISFEDLKEYLPKPGEIKALTLEVEFKDGYWDICDGDEEQQSRMGQYAVVHRIITQK